MRRAPKYVRGFIDRHGKPRWYFRRRGFRPVPLPGLPWSPEFMAAYETALAGQRFEPVNARVKPGTMRALALSYFNSLAFRQMKASTQRVYRNIIDRFLDEADKEGHKIARRAPQPCGASTLTSSWPHALADQMQRTAFAKFCAR
jgi:hypothetical protein